MAQNSPFLWVRHLLRKVFLEDWGLKLIALLIAVALWVGVTGLSTPTVKRFTVPLAASAANNVEVTNQLVSDVDIVLTGDKRDIDRLNRSDLTAVLDLTDVPPGDRVVSLSPANVYVSLPQGIKLTEVQPGRIAVDLEAVEEKDVNVKPETAGKPAEGFEVYSVTARPLQIRIRAPSSIVRAMDSISTDPVDVTNKTEGFTANQVAVRSASPKVAVYSTVVDVFVRIGEKRIERSFTLPVPGSAGKTVSFTIFGPKTALSKAKAEDFKVDAGNGNSGQDAPQVILPDQLVDLSEIRKVKIN
ncbi:MAG: YbbR-like domain-containing protein [Pyrinomonadaceae bacterium]